MASFDTVALDTIAALIMGIKPDSIEYVRLASEQGLGTARISKIKVKGAKIKEVRRKFRQAEIDFKEFQKYGIKVIEGGACSGCKHTLETFLIKSEFRNQMLNIKNCTFLLGQNVKPPKGLGKKILKFGSCTKLLDQKGAAYIPGCPPHMDTIREILKKQVNSYW